MNISIDPNYSVTMSRLHSQNQKKESQSVFAGNMNLGSNPNQMINHKKELARKQAMKLMQDAFRKDEMQSQAIKDMKTHKDSIKEDNRYIKNNIHDVQETIDGLPEKYGIDKDSQEYKDYELLKKYQEDKIGYLSGAFSEGEVSRLKELQDTPLTDFQKEALSYNHFIVSLKNDYKMNEDKIKIMDQQIVDAGIDLLKTNDMGDAVKAADELLDAANKDVMGMIFEQAKNHIDEEFEDKKEKAEEEEKEIAEREERLERAREKKEEQEDIIEGEIAMKQMESGISNSESDVDHLEQAQNRIYHLMKENKMVNEDIKGIEIDLSF